MLKRGSLKAVVNEEIEQTPESESPIGKQHFPAKTMNLII
jgi:hypothetical protein